MRAKLIHWQKLVDPAGGIEERKIWDFSKSEKYPDGIRYRLAYIKAGQDSPVVLYDNHYPKGHHKHVAGRETAYQFSGVEQLLADFRQDIEALK
jgi:hypothetical protein